MRQEVIVFESIEEHEHGPEYVLRIREIEEAIAKVFGVPAHMIEARASLADPCLFGRWRFRLEDERKRP